MLHGMQGIQVQFLNRIYKPFEIYKRAGKQIREETGAFDGGVRRIARLSRPDGNLYRNQLLHRKRQRRGANPPYIEELAAAAASAPARLSCACAH